MGTTTESPRNKAKKEDLITAHSTATHQQSNADQFLVVHLRSGHLFVENQFGKIFHLMDVEKISHLPFLGQNYLHLNEKIR